MRQGRKTPVLVRHLLLFIVRIVVVVVVVFKPIASRGRSNGILERR
jgi:hypothetical protein